jgi:hypothetical protein
MELLVQITVLVVFVLVVWKLLSKEPVYDDSWHQYRRDIDKLPPITEHEGVDTWDVTQDPEIVEQVRPMVDILNEDHVSVRLDDFGIVITPKPEYTKKKVVKR